jgi:hypothetical protein
MKKNPDRNEESSKPWISESAAPPASAVGRCTQNVLARKGYNLFMPRAALLTALVAFVLTGSLQAQRAGGTFQSSAAGMGVRSGFVGPRGFPPGSVPRTGFFARRGFPKRFHLRHDSLGGVLVPYFVPDEESFAYEQPYPEIETNVPVSPVVLTPDYRQARIPASPAAKPQVIEVPGAANPTDVNALPPAMFVLKNGERLETRRFVLTASYLSVSIDLQQRTIPFEMLDIAATIAANHERGIDLRIPADRNEISLSF